MNDMDRWAAGEGPAPPRLRALLDAAREVPPMTPEEAAHLEHVLRRKLAMEKEAAARRRRMRRGMLVAGAVGAAVAAAAAVTAAFSSPRGMPDGLSGAILSDLKARIPVPSAVSKTTAPRVSSLVDGGR